jgi:hypothetical protein
MFKKAFVGGIAYMCTSCAKLSNVLRILIYHIPFRFAAPIHKKKLLERREHHGCITPPMNCYAYSFQPRLTP